jgi:hypothetical protein
MDPEAIGTNITSSLRRLPMSFTHPSETEAQSSLRSPLRKAGLATASLSLVLGALPLAATPAQAAFPTKATNGPCTVTAIRPEIADSFGPTKLVRYRFEVKCTKGGVTVHMQQQLREADPAEDDYHRDYFTPEDTPVEILSTDKKEMETYYYLPNSDGADKEEPYHKIRFWVEGVDGASKWAYAQSPEASIQAKN